MKKLILQKELALIKQVHQKNECFVIIGILKILVISLNHRFVMVITTVITMVIMITANILNNIAILNVKGVDYRYILWGTSKNEAVNILNNFLLEDKGVL